MASACRSCSWTSFAPTAATTTSPPCLATRRSASSTAIASKGLILYLRPSGTMPVPSALTLIFDSGSSTRFAVTRIFTPTPYDRRRMTQRAIAFLCAAADGGNSKSHRRSLSSGKLSEQLAGDHQPLDLRGPFVNLDQLGIPHQLLHGELLDVAVAAVDLHRVGGDPHRGVGGETLGATLDDEADHPAVPFRPVERGEEGELVRVSAVGDEAFGAVDDVIRSISLR